jgi:hypothetical protein
VNSKGDQCNPTAATGRRDNRGTYERCEPQADLGDPNRFHARRFQESFGRADCFRSSTRLDVAGSVCTQENRNRNRPGVFQLGLRASRKTKRSPFQTSISNFFVSRFASAIASRSSRQRISLNAKIRPPLPRAHVR